MKKKPKGNGLFFPFFKIDLKLKLTTLFLLVAIFNLRASTYAQSRVSLELKNATVENVIETIEQKTDYRFIYKLNDIDLARVISISAKNEAIGTVLEKLFKGTPTDFKVINNQIVLKKPVAEEPGKGAFIEKTITGKVTDENGLPLPGATILEENTKNATVTDMDGNFRITVAGEASVLIISFVGYEDKKIPASQDPISVKLLPQTNSLNEVVVIGYGSAAKKDVTGAIASVAAKDMNQGALVSPLQLITGKLAGVNITQTGSEPGSAPSIRIRGISSLMGGNDPLVVVDGVQGNMDLLASIPPTEIASIDILKDASATAIFGSRGAPGVVLVTTKRNKAGKTSIEYITSTSYDVIPKKLNMLNADEWWAQAQLTGVPASANHGSNTDWYNILTQNGVTQTHTLSFGGGAEQFSYRASLTAILQDGVVINSENQRYIGRIQADQTALDGKLKLAYNMNSGIVNSTNTVQSIGRAAFTSNLITNAYLMRPTDPVYNEDGTYYTDPNVFQYLNPYAVAQTVSSDVESDDLFGSLKADLDLFGGLSAGWFGSWRKTSRFEGFYLPAESTSANAIDQRGFANVRHSRQSERLMDVSLNYKKRFGKHNVGAMAVYEWQSQAYQGNFVQARGFINDITTYNALQNGDLSKVQPGDFDSYKNERKAISFLGRVNYSFDDRYLFTASLRRDGSTVFGANHKWGNYPAASIAWAVDQEDFMKSQKVINQLKFRLGYGITGNQQGLLPSQSKFLLGVGAGAAAVTYFGGQEITNFAITQNANADLRWETKKQTNFGVDFALLDSRLRGTFDVYTAKTEDLLFDYAVGPPLPFTIIKANIGSMRNQGLEVSLAYDVIRTDNTTLTLAGNLSLMQNKVLKLSGSINGLPLTTDYVGWGPNNYLIEGQPLGTFNILHNTGKDDSNSETVEDVNGDGIYDQGADSPDRKIQGQVLPKYTFAFNPTFQYKNLDVSVLFRGSGGNKVYNSLKASLSYLENIGKSNVFDSSVPLGVITSRYGSDLWLEDASFVRLENATIGYSFNFKDVRYIDSVRLSLTGNNLALFTNYSGIDPELNVSGSRDAGGDNGIYPRVRSFVFGLNVKFK